uniref:Uncharacterized protein n=1 Tax=Anguilla anguilla TaxID=7936 RepID=A0A0E9WIZ3_ANGAN
MFRFSSFYEQAHHKVNKSVKYVKKILYILSPICSYLQYLQRFVTLDFIHLKALCWCVSGIFSVVYLVLV